jgi:ADP-ribose pyrophosphatase YjhB (NUDIX family)
MQNSPTFAVTVRAIIVDQTQLFIVKHNPKHSHRALPGGRLEPGETLEDGLTRELIEETSIHPEIGPLLFINQWVSPSIHRIEFFFWIHNAKDYHQANPSEASHGFEISEFGFRQADDPSLNLLPSFLGQRFPEILKLGENFPTEIVRSF